jgi:hypothetical protein
LLIAKILEHLPEGVERCIGPGRNSYKFSDHLFLDEECVATVYHGGHNPHPNVKASGGDASRRHADVLADIIRYEFPVHRVTRIDVATDRRGEGAFDLAMQEMLAVAEGQRAHGRKFKQQLIDSAEDGRTLYLGSRASPYRVRCYEKGKERFAQTGDPFWLDYSDLFRLELQVRPVKAGKSTAATMEPSAFWGCTDWVRQVAQGVLAMNAVPVMLKIPRVPDHERAMRHLIAQYGPTLHRHSELLGSWEAVWRDFERRLGVAVEEAPQAA